MKIFFRVRLPLPAMIGKGAVAAVAVSVAMTTVTAALPPSLVRTGGQADHFWYEQEGDLTIENGRLTAAGDEVAKAWLRNAQLRSGTVSADVDLSMHQSGNWFAGLFVRGNNHPGNAQDRYLYYGAVVNRDGAYRLSLLRLNNFGWETIAEKPLSSPAGTLHLRFAHNAAANTDDLTLSCNGVVITATESLFADEGTHANFYDGNMLGVRLNGGIIDNFRVEPAAGTVTATSSAGTTTSIGGTTTSEGGTGTPPSTHLFEDTFDQSSFVLSSANWEVVQGQAAVYNNGLDIGSYNSTTKTTAIVKNITRKNISMQSHMNISNTAHHAGLVARYLSAQDMAAQGFSGPSYYMGRIVNHLNGFSVTRTAEIVQVFNGAETILASQPITFGGSIEGILRFDAQGSELKLFFDGLLVATANSSTIGQAGRFGIEGVYGRYEGFFADENIPECSDGLNNDPDEDDKIDADDSGCKDALGVYNPDDTSESFTSGDSGLPFADGFPTAGVTLGNKWNVTQGGFNVIMGDDRTMVQPQNNERNIALVNGISKDNVSIEAVVNAQQDGSNVGIVARRQPDGSMYSARLRSFAGGQEVEIWHHSPSGDTKLKSAPAPARYGALRFVASGVYNKNNLKVYFDGALLVQATSADVGGEGGIGIIGFWQVGGIESFLANAAAPPQGPTPASSSSSLSKIPGLCGFLNQYQECFWSRDDEDLPTEERVVGCCDRPGYSCANQYNTCLPVEE